MTFTSNRPCLTFKVTSRAWALLLTAVAAGCIQQAQSDGGGPPGGGGGGGSAPPDTSALLPTVGIVSAAAGIASAQVAWEASAPDGSPLAVALFQSSDEATLFTGSPLQTTVGSGRRVVTGLPNSQPAWFGLALDQGGQYTPVGSPVSVRPSAILFHVDAASTCGLGCGGGPGDPFPDVLTAVLVASSFGGPAGPGANVWVREGVYLDVGAPLHAGVDLYGGFGPGFDLATRDPATHPTLLRAQTGPNAAKAIVTIQDGKPGCALDGFELDGLGAASFGVDVDSSPARLASLAIRDCAGRGIRLRSLATNVAYDVLVSRCEVRDNGAEGLSGAGPFEIEVEGSLFSVNTLEGLDLDDLIAPAGVSASLEVRDSLFFGNGEEGLDCDLGAPPAPGAGSTYEVSVQGSRFERNGWKAAQPSAGLNIDIDFEAFGAWSADILVRGSLARDNRGAGFRLDLDSTASTCLHRLLSTANSGDGLLISSESKPGLALVSTSVFGANLGAGVRLSGGATGGNVAVSLAHCVLAGNRQGGVVSPLVESLASSSAAWLQPSAWSGAGGVREHFVAEESDALSPLFQVAPLEYLRVQAANGAELSLVDVGSLAVGDPVELADDGVARSVLGFLGADAVLVGPAPVDPDVPASLTRFAPGVGVDEDYDLAAGSAALGAGMPAPAGPAPDAGVLGAPLGGAPGVEGPAPPKLLRVGGTTPATTSAVGKSASLRVAFAGGTLDSLSIPSNVRARDGAKALIALDNAPFLDVGSGELVVPAPSGGWPQGPLTLELHAGLAAIDGTPLAVATALPFRVP